MAQVLGVRQHQSMIPKKNRDDVYRFLFTEGVIACQKNRTLKWQGVLGGKKFQVPVHQVWYLMRSFKSRGLVKEQFAWRHFYWFLNDDGINYLRQYLHLPDTVVPNSMKKSANPGDERQFERRAPRVLGDRGRGRGRGRGFGRGGGRGRGGYGERAEYQAGSERQQQDGAEQQGGFRGRGRGRGFRSDEAGPEYYCPKGCGRMSIPTISVSCDYCPKKNKKCDCDNDVCRRKNENVDPNITFWGCRVCNFDLCANCLHN